MGDRRSLVLAAFCVLAQTTWAAQPDLLSFRHGSTDSPFRLVAVDFASHNVYVSARNSLYHLSSNLETRMIVSTGPRLDNPLCPPPPVPCDHERVSTDNEPKILLVYPESHQSFLLLCGSLYHGVCTAFKIDDIVRRMVIFPTNETLGFVSGAGSTVGFLVVAGNSFHLVSATSYDDRPSAFLPVSVASRMPYMKDKLPMFKYSHETADAFSGVNFKERKNYQIEYVSGFQNGNFAYLLATQRVSVESEVIETRLARVCLDDPSFFSYTEVPLKCNYGMDVYNLATAAHLGSASPQLQRRLKLDENARVLYVSFVKTVPEHGRTVDESRGSVVCSFPMSVIIESFTNASRDCFQGQPRTALLRHVVGIDMPCTRVDDVKVGDDFCGSPLNHYIGGLVAIPGGFRTILSSHVTSLAILLQKRKTIAVVGTSNGDVIKLDLDKRENQILYTVNIAEEEEGSKAIQPSNALDFKMENIYFLTGNKIVKFPIGSCSLYTECSSCLTTPDPLQCGWCGDHCAHADECATPDSFLKTTCPPILHKIHPLVGPFEGGTLLTIEGDNFGMGQRAGEHQSEVNVTVVGRPCEIFSWKKTLLQCNTSKVPYAYNRNMNLEVGFVEVSVQDESWEAGEFNMLGRVKSKDLFSYTMPKLHDFSPTQGPVSGGTNVTLRGRNMDIGHYRNIKVAGVFCREIRFRNDSATCITAPLVKNAEAESRTAPFSGPVELIIDKAVLESGQDRENSSSFSRNFRYLPDPEIFDINPHTTTISGTQNLTIVGSDLDSVSTPRMVVNVASSLTGESLQVFSDVCRLNATSGGTVMVCPTPRMDLSDLHAPTDRAPLVTHVGFLMDGVQKLRQLPLHEREMSQLLYYPDPEFFPFHGVHEFESGTLQLKGQYLGLAHSKSDVEVVVDQSTACDIIAVQPEVLTCKMESNGEVLGTKHSVKVKVGPLSYHVGQFKFVEPSGLPWWISVPLAFLLVGSVIFVIFWLTNRLKCRSAKPARNYFAVRWTPEGRDACGEGGSRRQENANDYQDRPTVPKSVTTDACADAEDAAVVDDETMSLLKSEHILYDKRDLDLLDTIGQGQFGLVYKGVLHLHEKAEKLHVAVKTLRNKLQPNQSNDSFLQEGLMMKDFKHPNVLSLVGICFDADGCPMVITPFMTNGDLLSFIEREDNPLTIKDMMSFSKQIASGMNYLAKIKFVHRDLAARNCMLDEEKVVKIADFGLSRDIYDCDYYSCSSKDKKLPIKWMAPESLEKAVFTSKSDVWSYGVVVWELMTRGVIPYAHIHNFDMMNYLKSGRRLPQPSYCPDPLYEVLLWCWKDDPSERPTFQELEEKVQGIIDKMVQQHQQKQVGLDVTYVNCPEIVSTRR